MPKTRRKVSAVFNDFSTQLRKARKIDDENQRQISTGNIGLQQAHIITEALFFKIFRDYENFIRDVFILYAQGKPTADGTNVSSYLKPKNFHHTEQLLTSSLQYLDWNSPDNIIERADIYLAHGSPIRFVYTSKKSILNEYKLIRNHYAHNSTSSLKGYLKVIRRHFGANPIVIPSIGEYFLLISKRNPQKYYLLEFFDDLEYCADQIKK